jgi:hypothetical protein
VIEPLRVDLDGTRKAKSELKEGPVEHRIADLDARHGGHSITPSEAVLGEPAALPDVEDLVDWIAVHFLVEGLEHYLANPRSDHSGIAEDLYTLFGAKDC